MPQGEVLQWGNPVLQELPNRFPRVLVAHLHGWFETTKHAQRRKQGSSAQDISSCTTRANPRKKITWWFGLLLDLCELVELLKCLSVLGLVQARRNFRQVHGEHLLQVRIIS